MHGVASFLNRARAQNFIDAPKSSVDSEEALVENDENRVPQDLNLIQCSEKPVVKSCLRPGTAPPPPPPAPKWTVAVTRPDNENEVPRAGRRILPSIDQPVKSVAWASDLPEQARRPSVDAEVFEVLPGMDAYRDILGSDSEPDMSEQNNTDNDNNDDNEDDEEDDDDTSCKLSTLAKRLNLDARNSESVCEEVGGRREGERGREEEKRVRPRGSECPLFQDCLSVPDRTKESEEEVYRVSVDFGQMEGKQEREQEGKDRHSEEEEKRERGGREKERSEDSRQQRVKEESFVGRGKERNEVYRRAQSCEERVREKESMKERREESVSGRMTGREEPETPRSQPRQLRKPPKTELPERTRSRVHQASRKPVEFPLESPLVGVCQSIPSAQLGVTLAGAAQTAPERSRGKPSSSVTHLYAVADTNVLLHDLQLVENTRHYSNVTLVIPMAVVRELDGLKCGQNYRAQQARAALHSLRRMVKEMNHDGPVRFQHSGEVPRAGAYRGHSRSNDDRILECCLYYAEAAELKEGRRVVLLTNDVALQVKAQTCTKDRLVTAMCMNVFYEREIWKLS